MMNIFSYVDSSKLFHVIKYFPLLKQIIGQEYITFPLSSIPRGIEWQHKISIELESYVDKIDTSLYHDFTINQRYFNNDFIFVLGNYIRDTRDELFRKQNIYLRTLFITLCFKSHNKYCFNILIIIELLYHFYIDNEIYHMK